MGGWGDGEMGRWGDKENLKFLTGDLTPNSFNPKSLLTAHCSLLTDNCSLKTGDRLKALVQKAILALCIGC